MERVFPAHAAVGAAVVIVVAALLVWTPQKRGHDWGGDFAGYLLQADALAHGGATALRDTNREMMHRGDNLVGPDLYVWGFPLLMAPLAAVGVDQPLLLKRYVGGFLVAVVAVCLVLFRRRGDPPSVAVAAAGLVAVQPRVLFFRDQLLSDFPYLLWSLLALLAIDRVRDALRHGRPSSALLLAAGAGAGAATAVRHNGAVLAVVLLAVLAVEAWPAWRRLGAGTVVRSWTLPWLGLAAVMAPVTLWLPDPHSGYAGFAGRPTANTLRNALDANVEVLGSFLGDVAPVAVGCVVLPALAVGIGARLRRDYALVLYALGTLGLYTLWPPSQGARYLFGVAVPLTLFVVTGLWCIGQVLLRRAPAGLGRVPWGVALATVLAALLLGQALREAGPALAERQTQGGPYTAAADEAFTAVEELAAEDDWIAFFKPRVMLLRTGRRAFMTRDPARLEEADLVVVHLPSGAYDQVPPDHPALGRLEKVFVNAEFAIYRVPGDGPDGGSRR